MFHIVERSEMTWSALLSTLGLSTTASRCGDGLYRD
jgi:hypothetical protein